MINITKCYQYIYIHLFIQICLILLGNIYLNKLRSFFKMLWDIVWWKVKCRYSKEIQTSSLIKKRVKRKRNLSITNFVYPSTRVDMGEMRFIRQLFNVGDWFFFVNNPLASISITWSVWPKVKCDLLICHQRIIMSKFFW